MKISRLALLSALVPMAALIGGCGGGSGSGPSTSNNTPVPAFTPFPVDPPSFPDVTLPQTLLRLPSGQIAVLNLTRNGNALDGELRVLGGISSPRSLDADTYQVSGVAAQSGAFNLTSQGVNSQGVNVPPFTLTGNLPKGTGTGAGAGNSRGNFIFSSGRISGAASAATDGQNVAASSGYRPIGALTFSPLTTNTTNVGGGQGQGQTFVAPVTRTGSNAFTLPSALNQNQTRGDFVYGISGTNSATLGVSVTGSRNNAEDAGQNLVLSIRVTNAGSGGQFTAGRAFEVGTNKNEGFITGTFAGSTTPLRGISGTIVVTEFTSDSVSLDLRNVTLSTTSNTTSGTSTTINGTFEATGIDTRFNAS